MFASSSDRLSLRSQGHKLPFVVRFEKSGLQSEIACDGLSHALAVNAQWIDNGASYVEIFRVLHDGELNPTIGAHRE